MIVSDSAATMQDVRRTAELLNQLAVQLAGLSNELGGDAKKFFTDTSQLTGDANATIGEVRKTAQAFGRLADDLDKIAATSSTPIRDFTSSGLYELSQFVSEARTLVGSLTRLAYQLERDPARFLFGDQQRATRPGNDDARSRPPAGRRAFLAYAGLLALGACQLPGGGEPPSLYTLTPKSTFNPDLPKVDWQLIVETPVAAAGLNTSRIALQRSPVTLEYYANANWTDIAPLMVQTLLIESSRTPARSLPSAASLTTLRADYLLKTELREFQVEYDGSGPPRARVRINAKLARMPDRAIIASYTVERMERAQSGDLPTIALAFDEALGGAMRRIVEWSLTAPGSTAPPRR